MDLKLIKALAVSRSLGLFHENSHRRGRKWSSRNGQDLRNSGSPGVQRVLRCIREGPDSLDHYPS